YRFVGTASAEMAAADAEDRARGRDPCGDRFRIGAHAGARRGAPRYRGDVHATEPPRSEGRALVRGAADLGVERPEPLARTWPRLRLHRLGTRILCQAQR